ncbi:MAG: hypothetical protein CMO80_16755 [Verrucomicrobiales bacterium]|nr:hypothetical protein [Verrucomicrobiales bacterium]|tara:strand:+ start:2939 stop:3835 length:897 start_codon:yes stop_codon:yes gene_type:complete
MSELTRREFQLGAGCLLAGGSILAPLVRSHGQTTERSDPMAAPMCDFQTSFMTWHSRAHKDSRPHARHNVPHGNMVRIQLEALIDRVDRKSGVSERFVLIAPCITEWVYAEDRLFQKPSAEFRNIYSATEHRPMTRRIIADAKPARGRTTTTRYHFLTFDVNPHGQTRMLPTAKEIVEVSGTKVPLVGRTRIDDPKGQVSWIMEYPIKTMNFMPKTNSFQVDTGPILVPDHESKADEPINRLEMAYVAYNRLDRAEFILRRPTPINNEEGQPLCEVLHYSKVREEKARNVLLAAMPAA